MIKFRVVAISAVGSAIREEMGCGASTANLPERGESPSPLKNKPGAALATTDFTDVDANDDGAITVAELASALEQHGEQRLRALEGGRRGWRAVRGER